MTALPTEWIECTFEGCNTFQSKTLDPALYGNETFELYSVPSFPTGMPEFVKGGDIGSTKQLVQAGDILVCKINPRLNRVWQVKPPTDFRQIASSEWIVMRSTDLNANYLKYYFRSPDFRELICEGVTGVGGSLTRAQPKNVATFLVPLAPLKEQKRIADELDVLLTQVDFCRRRLDRIPELIKRFRQNVLDSATSGSLTEEWRQASGYDKGGWKQIIFQDACHEITVGFVGKMADQYRENGVPFLRSQNVRPFRFDQKNLLYISKAFHNRILKSRLRAGDVVVVRSGAPGQCCVIPGHIEEANCSDLVIVRPKNELLSEYACIFINASTSQEFVQSERVGVAQSHFNVGSMKITPLDLPSVEEQTEIVRRVGILFDFADRLEARVHTAQKIVEQVTPALLSKAFRGELVPKDPNDEPASVLLERIQQARAEQQRIPRTPSTKRTKVVAKTLQEIAPTHLTDTLLENGGKLTPEELLRLSELTLDDFYTQIKREMKTIRDVRPDDQTRFLEAIS